MTRCYTIQKNPNRLLWRYRVRWTQDGFVWTLDKMTLRAARRYIRGREREDTWEDVE